MRKGFVATLCALALLAMAPAFAQDTRFPLTLTEKAAFCGLETAMAITGDIIEHQGCSKTVGSYPIDLDVVFGGGTNVFATLELDNLVLEIELEANSTKGEQWKVSMPQNGDFDNVSIDRDSVMGACSNTTIGEIMIGIGKLTIDGTCYDWTFIKDFYEKKIRWGAGPKKWVIIDKGLEVITKLGYPRAKYRQYSKYTRPNGGDGKIYWKKKRIAPSNAPNCQIILQNLDVDSFGEGLQVDGELRVKN